jgi:hypothetical protein
MEPVRPLFAEATAAEIRLMRICVGANLGVIASCAAYLVLQRDASGIAWPHILAALAAGYFAADFASGLVHWSMDTWFDERILGRAVAIAREHHTHPQHILGYSFLEHATLGSAPSAVVVGIASLVTALLPPSVATYCLMLVWLVVSSCLLFGTSFHNLCHRGSTSPVVRLARKARLIVAPDHHWMHHRTQTIHYCVINGWANPLCDRLLVWRRLERLVQAASGAVPRRDDRDWQRRCAQRGSLTARMNGAAPPGE